jgi:ribosomal protein S18 acetylase RimI-like enzyme
MMGFGTIGPGQLWIFLSAQAKLAAEAGDVDLEVLLVPPTTAADDNIKVTGIYWDNELVGYARMDMSIMHLSHLYVSPAARGRGLASHFFNLMRPRSLQVMPANVKAQALYRRWGFEVAPLQPNSARILMVRPQNHIRPKARTA